MGGVCAITSVILILGALVLSDAHWMSDGGVEGQCQVAVKMTLPQSVTSAVKGVIAKLSCWHWIQLIPV